MAFQCTIRTVAGFAAQLMVLLTSAHRPGTTDDPCDKGGTPPPTHSEETRGVRLPPGGPPQPHS